ncbi:MAG: hypothetical protein UIH41_03820 [Treponemataceae bacterium]|nr:hypothetical protein [Treponemataceae bacterium]
MKVQLSQIEDFESSPSRMKIQWKERKNGRRQELVNDREWYHFSEFYDECKRFIRANVGRNFDTVFSEFCKKYPKFIKDINTRAHFMDEFRRGVHDRYFFNEFEVDNQNRIKLIKRPKRERRGITYYDGNNVEIGILINTTLLNHPKIFSYFCNKVDKDTFMMLYYGSGEITPEQYRKIFWRTHADEYELSNLIDEILIERQHAGFKGFNWQPNTTVKRSLYHLFKEYYKGVKVTIHKKDKDYDKIRYELEDLNRKLNRENKRSRKEYIDNILGYVFEKRKEQDRIKAAQERARDIITRDRLGFDEYSFRGETKYGEVKERK